MLEELWQFWALAAVLAHLGAFLSVGDRVGRLLASLFVPRALQPLRAHRGFLEEIVLGPEAVRWVWAREGI